jgi:uncharacterized protein YndB with AHSA1/START domain
LIVTEVEVLKVSIHLDGAPEDAFPYFTDEALYIGWMGSEARLDATPGGEYWVQMADGFAGSGTFIEVSPPHRLVFTWGWAPGAGQAVLSGAQEDSALPPGSTRVEVNLEEDDGGTSLLLQHFDLPTDELREGHRIAWEAYLDRLRIRRAGGDPGPEPHSSREV